MATVRIDAGPCPSTESALWEDDAPCDTDEHLLDRFIALGESEAEAAFREIVARHGPMVLGVCRHVLGEPHDAEDAFQATFLVLARRAGTIRDRRVLARWLYEVAYRIAVRSKTQDSRRRARERRGAVMAAVGTSGDVGRGRDEDPAWAELRPVLLEEVRRLPEKYREAVVLCYLEGRTNEEAAALLEWPVGTVKGRLFRAREMLRARLTRRGLALSAALLAVRLSRNAVFAEVVPSRLADATAAAAVRAARAGATVGTGVGVSERVLAMVEEGLKPNALAWIGRQLGVLALALVLVGAVYVGLSGASERSRPPVPPPSYHAAPPGSEAAPATAARGPFQPAPARDCR